MTPDWKKDRVIRSMEPRDAYRDPSLPDPPARVKIADLTMVLQPSMRTQGPSYDAIEAACSQEIPELPYYPNRAPDSSDPIAHR